MRKRIKVSRTLAVGVTGGIASGKSEVCSVFSRLGAEVIRSDELAKQLLSADPVLQRRIVRLLGPEAVSERGVVNRRYIAGKVFRDKGLRGRVNAVIHPAVIKSIRKTIRERKKEKTVPLVAVESALIYEARISSLFDAVIVVTAPQVVRIRRMRDRDGISAAEGRRRIAAQAPSKSIAARADIEIVNRGDIRSLRETARFVFSVLLLASGKK